MQVLMSDRMGYAAGSSCRLAQARGQLTVSARHAMRGPQPRGQTACSTAAWLTDPSSSSESPHAS